MPELAEVEYYRRQWEPGVGQRIQRVALHAKKRVFRCADTALLEKSLVGARLAGSEARGKQMIFRFTPGGWLSVHLGMTGELKVERADYEPAAHDHLVLFQARRALVFRDPRMFGRIGFDAGRSAPEWWRHLPPEVISKEFTRERLAAALARRKSAPLKAVLLDQELFPGIGNWMADEILWQCALHPRTSAAALDAERVERLWKCARTIAKTALETIGVDWGDPPADWLFHQRWTKRGTCPRHGTGLEFATVGGRTTAWCAQCQPAASRSVRARKRRAS